MKPHSPAPAPQRVSTLELFFDLVFVFTITQVADVVVHAPNINGVAHAAIELWVIMWMYGGYEWLTNAAGPDTAKRRVLILSGMAAFFVCALAVPHAFDDDGLVFGVGYFLINLIHITGLILEPGRTPLPAVLRLAPFNLVSAGLVLAAGWYTGPIDWTLWGLAIAVQLATPLLSRTEQGFVINAEHFAERNGLVILIVLGESLVSVGLSAQGQHVDSALALGGLAGLAAATAMWFAYFVDDDSRAAKVFEQSDCRGDETLAQRIPVTDAGLRSRADDQRRLDLHAGRGAVSHVGAVRVALAATGGRDHLCRRPAGRPLRFSRRLPGRNRPPDRGNAAA